MGDVVSSQQSMSPLLRWAGSKRQLVPRLKAYWDSERFSRYVEPFAGSAALFFDIAPESAWINDLNGELIEAYHVLRKHPKRVFSAVAELSADSTTYYAVRSQNPRRLSPLRRAVRFLYLNRFCFNGIFRTNSAGDFNVPYGGQKSGNVPRLEEFRAAAGLLADKQLAALDFGRILGRTRRGDFVYLDPPYCKPSRRRRGEYGPGTFSQKDLARLKAHLLKMHRRGVAFVLSYEESAAGRTLYHRAWHKQRVRVRRNVAGFVGRRRRASELLISNLVPPT